MKTKVLEKEKAIELRKMGNSYKDINIKQKTARNITNKMNVPKWCRTLSKVRESVRMNTLKH